MAKRLRNAVAIFIAMTIVLLCVGCTGNEVNIESVDHDPDIIGFIMEGIDVPEDVLSAAKTQAKQLFDINREDHPNYGYTNWRIENLVYSYTYDDLNGMQIAIYQMNYEFLTDSPENIVLAGGMYITEDNWVMPGYPNSTYLLFHQDGDKLNYIRLIVENDCTPGTQLFTEDLLEILTQY